MPDTPDDAPSRYRVHRRAGGFTPVPNEVVADDEQLSYLALGLLTFMLSKPDGWAFSRDRLARGTEAEQLTGGKRRRPAREGREAVAGALRQLTAAGHYRTVRVPGPGGRWSTRTEVTDTPHVWPVDEPA